MLVKIYNNRAFKFLLLEYSFYLNSRHFSLVAGCHLVNRPFILNTFLAHLLDVHCVSLQHLGTIIGFVTFTVYHQELAFGTTANLPELRHLSDMQQKNLIIANSKISSSFHCFLLGLLTSFPKPSCWALSLGPGIYVTE